MPSRLFEVLLGLALIGAVGAEDAPKSSEPMPAPVDYVPPVARWAIPSDTGHWVGYYIGGGCFRLRQGEPRRADEGTWGWDYQGWLIQRRVMLDWWHGRRYQGGTGAYKTDGPHLYHHEEEAK